MIAAYGSQQALITIIIPTMWRASLQTQHFIRSLSASELQFELIVINNSPEKTPDWFKPLVAEGTVSLEIKCNNIFVNPAWNLGVQSAKTEFVALVNDDISFNPHGLYVACEHLRRFGGVVGLDTEGFQTAPNTPCITRNTDLKGGWATMMLFHRTAFRPIPEDIKIWCGDLIILKTLRPAWSVMLQDLVGEMNATASDAGFNEQKKRDGALYAEWLKRNRLKIAFIKAKSMVQSIRHPAPRPR